MSNLSITTLCNKRCAYCFAGDTRQEDSLPLFMSDEIYEKALDHLVFSGIKQVRLLGGEPTLHPSIITMIDKALKRKFNVLLFSNGLINKKVLSYFEKIESGKFSILLNTIDPIENNAKLTNQQQLIMRILSSKVKLGINIYNRQQEYSYLLDYIDKYKLMREIRLGISHPLLEGKNEYLHPKFYSIIGKNIVSLLVEAKKRKIKLGFDCGFVPCMFPVESYDLLGDMLKNTGKRCNPILDLLTNGTFISCYPLNNVMKIKLEENLSSKKIINEFRIELAMYSNFGIYNNCTECAFFKEKFCTGGCTAMKIKRLRSIKLSN
jgi:radical SAM protein with 4Fe4S-binding SPASM domain